MGFDIAQKKTKYNTKVKKMVTQGYNGVLNQKIQQKIHKRKMTIGINGFCPCW